jgi:branched-chain amino acid transport system substrate-binding protein
MAKPIRAVATVAITAMALAACGGGSSPGESGGEGGTLIISSDLPLQGSSKDTSEATNRAIKLYLKQRGNKAGKYKIEFKEYDDSTAAKGGWDDATCKKNATTHVATANEVAVMGTFNSGCAKLEAGVLNQDPKGPMLMVSHANTNVGLTKAAPLLPGEPEKFFPTGKRSYARVITTDDHQGAAAADFLAKDKGVKRCYILNDNQTYGQGLAAYVAERLKTNGVEVLGNEAWDGKASDYTSVFQKIKAKNPDCIYLAGIFDLNGGKLVTDKVSVLGDNSKVFLMAPDGFTGRPELNKLPQAQGMYLTFAGFSIEQLVTRGGPAKQLLEEYEKEYKTPLQISYALYGVAAVQVILDAIEKSDGTRKGVRNAVFEGTGVSIPVDRSIIGKEIKIDPATGDTTNLDISVETVKDQKETFLKVQPAS